MAGTLPGVGVSSRRKLKPNHTSFTCGREWTFNHSMYTAANNTTTTTTMDLDETALRARQRLEKKLGYSHPSSPRSSRSNQHRTQRILVWASKLHKLRLPAYSNKAETERMFAKQNYRQKELCCGTFY